MTIKAIDNLSPSVIINTSIFDNVLCGMRLICAPVSTKHLDILMPLMAMGVYNNLPTLAAPSCITIPTVAARVACNDAGYS